MTSAALSPGSTIFSVAKREQRSLLTIWSRLFESPRGENLCEIRSWRKAGRFYPVNFQIFNSGGERLRNRSRNGRGKRLPTLELNCSKNALNAVNTIRRLRKKSPSGCRVNAIKSPPASAQRVAAKRPISVDKRKAKWRQSFPVPIEMR